MSRLRNGDKPAHPVARQTFTDNAGDHPMETTIIEQFGLTKREYFSGLAMQGALANERNIQNMRGDWQKLDAAMVARLSVRLADALLAALEATP